MNGMNEIKTLEGIISRRRNSIQQLKLDLSHKKIAQQKDLDRLKDLKAKEHQRLLDEARSNCFERLNIKEDDFNNLFIVFDIYGEYVETINQRDYNSLSEVEEYLKSKKLYAHRTDSFIGRSIDWYKLSLKDQLIKLGWIVGDNGAFLNLSW